MPNYFYEDEEKTILKESLLTGKAENWVKMFLKPRRSENRYERNPFLTSAQLRKFYSEVKSLETKIEAKGFPQTKPLVKMLKSKAAYACPKTGRERKIPVEFREYIYEMVDAVEDEKDFKAFAIIFEAVVGFFYGEGGR